MFEFKKCVLLIVFIYNKFEIGFGDDDEDAFEETDVVIIGGGAAGIAAAKVLYEANINFLLLEADGRIGGRIKNQRFGEYMVENGANWIEEPYTDDDPPINNPIWNFKKHFNIQGNFTDYSNGKFVMRNGANINETIIKKWQHEFDEAMLFCTKKRNDLWEEAEKKKLKVPESIDITLTDCFKQYGYNNRTLSNIEKLVAKTLVWEDVDSCVTLPAENISLMHNKDGMERIYIEDDFFVTDQRGYAIFLEEIAKPFSKFIRLHHQVTAIEYKAKKGFIMVKTKSRDLTSQLTTFGSTKQKVRAKYVICTVPLGVLQRKVIHFHPPLPTKKLAAIHSFKMGIYAKVYLQFPINFWGQNETLLIVGEPVGFLTWALNLDHPKYFPGSNMITFLFVGDIAVRIESQDVKKTEYELMTELRKLRKSIPDPLRIHVTNWTNNPFSYGSYSAWPIGFTYGQWKEIIKNEGRLYFAGEHTSEQFTSMVHGAFMSGKNVANVIQNDIQANNANCVWLHGDC